MLGAKSGCDRTQIIVFCFIIFECILAAEKMNTDSAPVAGKVKYLYYADFAGGINMRCTAGTYIVALDSNDSDVFGQFKLTPIVEPF